MNWKFWKKSEYPKIRLLIKKKKGKKPHLIWIFEDPNVSQEMINNFNELLNKRKDGQQLIVGTPHFTMEEI